MIELPTAYALIIEETHEGIFLFRLGQHGEDAGDTWHEDLDGALHQASFEYQDRVGEWKDIPNDITDAAQWVEQLLKGGE